MAGWFSFSVLNHECFSRKVDHVIGTLQTRRLRTILWLSTIIQIKINQLMGFDLKLLSYNRTNQKKKKRFSVLIIEQISKQIKIKKGHNSVKFSMNS